MSGDKKLSDKEKVRLLRIALAELLMVISVDELIPESVSYMQEARKALEDTSAGGYEMSEETTAQRLARFVAQQLSTMQAWGADYNFTYLTGTRLEVQFRDGEKIVIAFVKKS